MPGTHQPMAAPETSHPQNILDAEVGDWTRSLLVFTPHDTHQRWDGGRDEGRGAGCGEGAARGTRLHLTLDESHERPSFPVPMTSVRTALDRLSIYTLQQSTSHPSRCLGRSSTSLQCFRPRCRRLVLAGAREGGCTAGRSRPCMKTLIRRPPPVCLTIRLRGHSHHSLLFLPSPAPAA